MRVTFIGHAGLKIETDGATLLCDPWLSPEGAFQASWFQFPENSHLVTPELCEPTALVISHEHLDHVDPWFLSRVPSHVPAVIFRFPSPVLRRKILSAGERPIIEAEAWEQVEVGRGTTVFFVPEPSPMNHDVGVVVEADRQTLLNLNDARLAPMQFREIKARVGGTVDLFALQGAGASWYPMCYDYDDERQQELSRQKRLAKFAYMTRAIRVVKPLAVLPFAGPPCFLDPELQSNNRQMEGGIFPDQQQVAEWLLQRGVANVPVLLPGDAWDVGAKRKEGDARWSDFSFGDRWRYIEEYAERRQDRLCAVLARYPEPTGLLWEAFRDYFDQLISVNGYFNRRIGMRVGFDITGPGGGMWAVDFRPGSEGVYREMGLCEYRYSFASRWAGPLIRGDMPWEDFFLSLRFRAARDPDLYNDHLLGLLKHANRESLEAVERFETSLAVEERILIRADGHTYRCQRHCPHAGNDLLESGEVLPGRILRCLAHHYEFSLETGACLNGTCAPLEVERVD